MSPVLLTCLRQDHVDPHSGAVYPLYCGFSTASELVKASAAPSFTESSPHHDIASKVRRKPAEDWQRPLNQSRVNTIASVFSDPTKIMPNPVLLAEDVTQLGKIAVNPKTTPGGHPTGLFEVVLNVDGDKPPLWILDGQHRINGLAKSTRAGDALPFVLLVKDGANSYSPSQFAEIFAQVTTEAEDLKPEHREWLSYAFELGRYNPAKADAGASADAFETAVDLCARAASPSDPRPFYNAIRFNPFPPAAPRASTGGFGRTCQDLAALLKSAYYGRQVVGAHLSPADLATQLSKAYVALSSRVTNPATSVFFANDTHEMQVVQDAFLRGVLSYLLQHGVPRASGRMATWETLLDALNFSTTSWDFTPWVRSLSGKAQSDSNRIASAVFIEVFATAALPPPSVPGGSAPTIVDVLKGTGGVITALASAKTPKGKVSRAGQSKYAFPVTGNGSINLSGAQELVSVAATSPNVARTSLQIASGAGGVPTRYGKSTIGPSVVSPPYSLYVHSHLFGGIEQVLDISVT